MELQDAPGSLDLRATQNVAAVRKPTAALATPRTQQCTLCAPGKDKSRCTLLLGLRGDRLAQP